MRYQNLLGIGGSGYSGEASAQDRTVQYDGAVPTREPIRVLWVIKGLGPGGAEQLLVNAARVHDRSRFEIECAYVIPWKDHLAEPLTRAGVRVRCLSTSRSDRRWPLALRALIRDGRFDVVHVHSPLPGAVARLVVKTLPRSTRPEVVTTEHNAWGTFAVPTRWINRLTIRGDRAVIAVSDEARQSMRGPTARRAETLAHGVDVAGIAALRAEREVVRAELGIGLDELVIGTVANYRAQKDYPNLLHAARVLADRGVSARVVAVGQGPLETDILRLRDELDLRERVLLTGFRADATRVMAACDVFTLASKFEGLPVALMEALALGLPVVATAVGGIAEALGDGEAMLVPPSDPAPLAEGWMQLIEHPDRRAGLAESSVRVAPRFDVRRAVDRLEQVYTASRAPPWPILPAVV